MKLTLGKGSSIFITDGKGNTIRVAACNDRQDGYKSYLQISIRKGRVIQTHPKLIK